VRFARQRPLIRPSVRTGAPSPRGEGFMQPARGCVLLPGAGGGTEIRALYIESRTPWPGRRHPCSARLRASSGHAAAAARRAITPSTTPKPAGSDGRAWAFGIRSGVYCPAPHASALLPIYARTRAYIGGPYRDNFRTILSVRGEKRGWRPCSDGRKWQSDRKDGRASAPV